MRISHEATQRSPRQDPSFLHDTRRRRGSWRAQAYREPVDRGWPTHNRRRASLPHPGSRPSSVLHAREPIKQRCQPGEFFCLGCRRPKRPAGEVADYISHTATRGSLCGICPTCDRMIYRAVSRTKIDEIRGGLAIAYPKAERRIGDSAAPLSNVAFKQDERE